MKQKEHPEKSKKMDEKKSPWSAGFEPARAEPNRFLVYRLNHSATTTSLEDIREIFNQYLVRCSAMR